MGDKALLVCARIEGGENIEGGIKLKDGRVLRPLRWICEKCNHPVWITPKVLATANKDRRVVCVECRDALHPDARQRAIPKSARDQADREREYYVSKEGREIREKRREQGMKRR